MSTAIEIRNINKSYGDLQALADINLDIKKGEFFGLLGPNGAAAAIWGDEKKTFDCQSPGS